MSRHHVTVDWSALYNKTQNSKKDNLIKAISFFFLSKMIVKLEGHKILHSMTEPKPKLTQRTEATTINNEPISIEPSSYLIDIGL